jgi:hypothetical protein
MERRRKGDGMEDGGPLEGPFWAVEGQSDLSGEMHAGRLLRVEPFSRSLSPREAASSLSSMMAFWVQSAPAFGASSSVLIASVVRGPASI